MYASTVSFGFVSTSYAVATLGMSGWLDLTQQGLSPCKKRQASLGAPTLELSCLENAYKEFQITQKCGGVFKVSLSDLFCGLSFSSVVLQATKEAIAGIQKVVLFVSLRIRTGLGRIESPREACRIGLSIRDSG